ncbi:MAG: LptF/LptG family permease [Alphaproteobacteria bacterium]|nr:LptF/LptG family permease [Alphaproteobacteria bacterium]
MARNRILSRFLFRRFFGGVGLVLLIVCGIIFAVTFVERLPNNPTIIAALNDAWVRLIEYVPLFLPLAVFMGTLVAYYTLTRSSEGVIISGAGLSPYQMSRPFLVGAFLIGVIATTVINPYAVELGSKNITDEKLRLVDDAIWLRESGDDGYITLVAKNMKKNGDNLIFLNTTIYVQNTEFKLDNRIDTDKITLSETGLKTEHATILDRNGKTHSGPWQTDTRITPQTVLDRYLQPDQISFWKLPKFITKMSNIGISVRGHLVQFWTLLFLPLTMISMATLGVAFSQTRQRRNHNFGLKFGLGILTCFILYFLLNIFSVLGANGTLPTLLAIIAPPLIIISVSGVFIASFDTI